MRKILSNTEIGRLIINSPGYRNLSLKSFKFKINLSVKVIFESKPWFKFIF